MSNWSRLQTYLQEKEIDAMLLTNMASVRWATGFTGSFGLAIVQCDSGLFITDSRYKIQAAEECAGLETRSFANPTKVEDFLKDQLIERRISKLHFDHGQVTVSTFNRWKELFGSIELVAIDDPVDLLRMEKSEEELNKIRAACRLTDDCLGRLIAMVQPGRTEKELQWAFEDMLRAADASMAFPPIIVSGPRTARPHATASTRAFEPGDFITFDIGARLDGYCSDITRTVVLGPASSRQREIYEHLLKTQVACIEAMRPGAKSKEVDALARRMLDEKELGKYFGHGLGHGLGALVHDTGRLSPTVEHDIQVGQVWTIEPGVYIEDFGGIRIEDDVVINATGCEVLTKFPKHLMEVPLRPC